MLADVLKVAGLDSAGGILNKVTDVIGDAASGDVKGVIGDIVGALLPRDDATTGAALLADVVAVKER